MSAETETGQVIPLVRPHKSNQALHRPRISMYERYSDEIFIKTLTRNLSSGKWNTFRIACGFKKFPSPLPIPCNISMIENSESCRGFPLRQRAVTCCRSPQAFSEREPPKR
jgi:hypothetical protein